MAQDYIDIYCERLGPGFWAEPFNAVSNLAFLISGALLTATLSRSDGKAARDPALWGLVTLVFLIGAGSGLFHTLARRWAMVADITPITLFILSYSFLALRRFVRLGTLPSLCGVVLVLALTGGVPALTGFRGGSYLPALFVLLGLGLFLRFRGEPEVGRVLLGAGCLFAVSLGFRTADGPVCGSFPVGTHFLWHVLNAWVLYIVTRAMIRFPNASRR